MTRELPILFSGEMVRAILEGRKSQTRRIKKSDKPKYQIGDTLWVRETFAITEPHYADQPGVVYRATDPDWDAMEGFNWHPSIFMPRWASRITLEVTGVRCEQLHDITEDDVIAEGIERFGINGFRDVTMYYNPRKYTCNYVSDAVAAFSILWDFTNGKKHPWSSNPEVWVYEFKVKEK